nr:rhodanese-like domain-containing protein [Propionibacterium sp.]
MRTIEMDDFVTLWEGQDLTVLDVREPDEYVEGHVPGAVLIPLGQLARRVAEVPAGDPVYVICRSGNRSQHGMVLLDRAGREAVSINEGTMGWLRRGRQVVTGMAPR